ncbi:ABC transporter substrate-binding protein [Enterococcus wangshanyuanii]|uniref:Metal ABC transporter substrate-binding protein n=1 Tax=Enterococcus wangshanyuanii TaxID=2005703 RepID=A0ABQ1P1K1_9ENTE|nr:ABC transporter substrate-binding protein [Enterococcus wangshanyuanii]GGC89359.1 metal ABC transporter substrate-binding protein [Enterococcus wangshanyuanii]
MKKAVMISLLSLAIVTGCTSKEQQSSNKETSTGYPVTVQNFTRAEGAESWQEKEQTFDKVPEKVLANTRPAAELLLHLGLKDKIAGVGAVFGAPDTAVEKDFDQLNQLSEDYIGKEMALSVDPDLVYGRGGLFDNQDWGVGTVDSLNEMGINTFVLNSSVTGGTFDSVYDDIDNLGKVFNVADKADAFKNELKERQKTLETKLEKIKDDRTFAYIHTTDPNELYVYPAHNETFFNDIFTMVKLDNVFKDEKGEVSVEKLIETDPDVLILADWSSTKDGMTGEKMLEGIMNNAKLSSMQAIKNKQVYTMDYNYMFGYGYQSLDGIEKLADEMYPENE